MSPAVCSPTKSKISSAESLSVGSTPTCRAPHPASSAPSAAPVAAPPSGRSDCTSRSAWRCACRTA
eukprot:1619826-Lingulodinium_polyedra.AAC.1